MTDDNTRDELAQLHARVAQLEAGNRPKTRHRHLRRFLPLLIAGLLVALMPLSILAATPFLDLNGGPDHADANANIDLIFNAGITKGCTPTEYCPNDFVNREQMASFLARTAGLGANPPIANAKTAQTAANATQFGGQPPSAYLASTGDTTLRYSFYGITSLATGITFARDNGPTVDITTNAASGYFVRVPLDRPTSMFGVNLAVVAAQICYNVSAGAKIDQSELLFGDKGQASLIILDPTDRASTTNTCYSFGPASPATFSGALYLRLNPKFTATSQTISLHSITLTLRPTTAGAAGAGEFPSAPAGPANDTE